MPSKKSQTKVDSAAGSRKKVGSSRSALRSCDEIQIETRGQSIVITTDSEEPFELQVTTSITGTCRTTKGCFWDGQRWVC